MSREAKNALTREGTDDSEHKLLQGLHSSFILLSLGSSRVGLVTYLSLNFVQPYCHSSPHVPVDLGTSCTSTVGITALKTASGSGYLMSAWKIFCWTWMCDRRRCGRICGGPDLPLRKDEETCCS